MTKVGTSYLMNNTWFTVCLRCVWLLRCYKRVLNACRKALPKSAALLKVKALVHTVHLLVVPRKPLSPYYFKDLPEAFPELSGLAYGILNFRVITLVNIVEIRAVDFH